MQQTLLVTAQVVPKPHPLPPLHCVAEGEKQATGGLESLLSILWLSITHKSVGEEKWGKMA
jgi:hypothetical protein